MAYKSEGQSIETQRPLSAEDLRHAFEAAVCEIHRADAVARKLQHGLPIVSRARILGISRESAENARSLTRHELWLNCGRFSP